MNQLAISRLLLVIASLLGAAVSFAQTETYTFLFDNGNPIFLNRTNNGGVSIGARGQDGVLYRDGKVTTFSLPGSGNSPSLPDINDAGSVVGEYFQSSAPFVFGFLRRNGALTILQVPGQGRTTPLGLNNRDVVVGTVRMLNPNTNHSFIWENGSFTTFTVPGALSSNLWDINDAGVAVGEATTASSPTFQSYSFLYRNGVITPLPTFPGADRTRVFSINNRGEMTGMIISPGLLPNSQIQTGFVLRNGQFETFRILGSLSFVPFGIDDKGDITGTYFTPENFEGTTFIRRAR